MTEDEFRAENPGVLRIYDASTDEFRNATQRDIDILCRAALAWTTIREDITKVHKYAEGEHAKILAEISPALDENPVTG